MTANTAQPFSYHLSRSPSTLNRNIAKSTTDIRSNRASSASRERRNSLERNERTFKSPSQRAYYNAFSPINNYEFNNEPMRVDSPLLPNNNNQQLNSIDKDQPQRYRTRIVSTETMTETTQSTTIKRPQENTSSSQMMDKSTGTIRYHNIDLDPIDR